MADLDKLSFEQALERLEQVVDQLENGQPSLEESLKLFEEGMALKKLCTQKLERAAAAIKKLVEGEGGAVDEAKFEPGADAEG